MELKTPLYEAHLKAGGKIVPFAGYLLSYNYSSQLPPYNDNYSSNLSFRT